MPRLRGVVDAGRRGVSLTGAARANPAKVMLYSEVGEDLKSLLQSGRG
jgi:hypothetical protein